MDNNQKYNLFIDAVRIIRSLVDVFEAIADTYKDATIVQENVKVIEAQEVLLPILGNWRQYIAM